MPIYPTVAKCIQCGSPEVSQLYDLDDGSVVMCWGCGHRVVSEYSNAAKCSHCGNSEAIEFYDETDGVVIECPSCGHRECSGQAFPEYPRSIQCSQCGNTEASESYDDFDDGIFITCLRCGRYEFTGPARGDEYNNCGLRREIRYGAGCLQFKRKGETSIQWEPLHTPQQVADTEELAREKLQSGDYVAEDTYLTRWNAETRNVETVLGEFQPFLR